MTGAQIEHAMHRMIDQLPTTVSMESGVTAL